MPELAGSELDAAVWAKCKQFVFETDPQGCLSAVPSVSRDWVAAGLLIELYAMTVSYLGNDEGWRAVASRHSVGFKLPTDGQPFPRLDASGQTGPEAICRAALLAEALRASL